MEGQSKNKELSFVRHKECGGPRVEDTSNGKRSMSDLTQMDEDTLLETPEDQARDLEGLKKYIPCIISARYGPGDASYGKAL